MFHEVVIVNTFKDMYIMTDRPFITQFSHAKTPQRIMLLKMTVKSYD